jgi:hypothetical protein
MPKSSSTREQFIRGAEVLGTVLYNETPGALSDSDPVLCLLQYSLLPPLSSILHSITAAFPLTVVQEQGCSIFNFQYDGQWGTDEAEERTPCLTDD